MEKDTTPKDITPMKRKGIEMTVRGMKKSFPFIMGYKDDESVYQYDSAHYIDIIIDLNKLSEYMDVPVNPYWSNELSKDPKYNKVYTIWSYLNFPNEVDYTKDVTTHPGYQLGEEIKEGLSIVYSHIPDEYALHYKSTSGIFPDNPPIYRVRLLVNGYIMK